MRGKNHCLTYPCPKTGPHPLTKEVLLSCFKKHSFHKHVTVVTEFHKCEDGTPDLTRPHHHVGWTTNVSLDWRTLDEVTFEGCRPNIAHRRDNKKKFSKVSWLKYITKDLGTNATMVEDNFNTLEYLAASSKKTATVTAYVADLLFEDPTVTNWDLVQDPTLRSMVLRHKPQIDSYREFIRTERIVRAELQRFSDSFIDGLGETDLADVCLWWNYRMVEGEYSKDCAMLYMWAEKRSVQKSTLLKVMTFLANGDETTTYDFHDKGWQEKSNNKMRLLSVDALQTGKQISFSLLEKVGDNSAVTLKQRNKSGTCSFRGPVILTSNKHPFELKPLGCNSWDPKVLDERMWIVNFDDEPAAVVVDELCRIHGIDPKRWMDTSAPPKRRTKKRHLPPNYESNVFEPLPKRARIFM